VGDAGVADQVHGGRERELDVFQVALGGLDAGSVGGDVGAVLDVAGAPAQVRRLAQAGHTVVVVGADGKSGILACAQAKARVGPNGRVIGLAPSAETAGARLLRDLGLVDDFIAADARDAAAIIDLLAGRIPALADLVVNCVNDIPQLLRCDTTLKNNWIKVKTIGTKSNKSGIGARIYCKPDGEHRPMDEVRSGGSYMSQSDLRVHFGLGKATTADLDIHWPSGLIDKLAGVKANRVVTVIEGKRLS